MAGYFRLLIVLLVAAAGPLRGQTAPEPEQPGTPHPPGGKHREGWFRGLRPHGAEETPSPALDNVRRALEALTPEQRKRFQENFARWGNLPPEEKKALRDREEIRKKFMEEEVNNAIRELGIPLESGRREEFVRRYGEERRKIEEKLRQDMAERRKPLVHELLGRLKTEFSQPAAAPAPAPSSNPAASPALPTVPTPQ